MAALCNINLAFSPSKKLWRFYPLLVQVVPVPVWPWPFGSVNSFAKISLQPLA